MAPEVLDGAMYNNKADIWSIGTVFYELLFGRPPFLASNMIELMKNIKQKKLDIPKKINNISPEAEDALRKMLTVDPHERIDWDELFKHPITFYREEKIKKELEDTLKAHDLNLVLNISKFYINNNKVVQHVADINKKQDLNNYTREVARGQKKEQYKGPIFNEDKNREDDEEKKREEPKSSQKGNETDNSDLADLTTQETMRESLIKTVKRNSNRILHERNKYVFLASVAEDAISKGLDLSEYAGFVLVKKLLMMIDTLKVNLTNNVNMFKLEEWGHYVKTKEYKAILDYIKGEFDVFEVYYNCMFDRITNVKKVHPKIGVDFLGIVTKTLNDKIDKVYYNTLKDYTDEILLNLNKVNNPEEAKNLWLHADQIIDCMKLDERFVFEDSNRKQFNFRQFYEEIKNLDVDKISTRVKEKVKSL